MTLRTRNRAPRSVLTLCFAVALGLASANVVAEEADAELGAEDIEARNARARALFAEGVELSDASEWSEAASRFEQALELRDAPAIRYNLAVAYAELGRRAAAMAQLDRALRADDVPTGLQASIEDLVAEIEDEVGSIVIDAEDLDEGAVFLLDGVEIEAEDAAHIIRVEPGSHVVTATLDGDEIARVEIAVVAGVPTDARLERGATAVETSIEAAVEDDPSDQDDERPLVRDWRLWVGVGAGVVAIVAAVAIGVAASGDDDVRVEDPIHGNMDPGVLRW